jgi:ABC-type glycerol-3-phosphate transport system substrate-binding protein
MCRLFFILLILSIFLSACSPDVTLLTERPDASPVATLKPTATRSPTPAPSATATPDPALNVSADQLRGTEVILAHAWTGSAADLFQQEVNLFNLTNEWGITIRAESKAGYADLFDALSAPDHPDAALALPEHALAFPDQVIDLAPYMMRAGTGFTASERADFFASFLAQDQVDKNLLSLPFLRSARFIFYNTTWAQELGFTSAPQTTDDFRKQACAANQVWRSDADQTNDGYGGWLVDADPFTAYSWLAAFDGGILSDGKIQFETESNRAALEFLQQLREDGCAWLSPDAQPFDHLAQRRALFVTGSLGEALDANAAFYKVGSKDQWTLIPFPGGQPIAIAYGPSFMLMKSTPAKQMAAWLFFRWMLDAERQTDWVEETGLMPVRSSVVDSLNGYRIRSPQWSAAVDLIPQMKTYPQTASWRVTRQILSDGFFSIFRLSLPANFIPDVLKQMQGMADDLIQP